MRNSPQDTPDFRENMSSDQKIPVWLDCDPGHDDAFAILLAAYHPRMELLGVSTVFGNASLEKTTMNASSILTAIGKHNDIPLYPGAYNPLSRPQLHSPTDIHGDSGLDGTDLLPKGLAPVHRHVPAVDAMASALKAQPRGTAYLVATGALTNVATLFRQYPELAEHVKGLSIMGGAIGGGFSPAIMGVVDGAERIGNWTQFAEFNIVIDPEAAESIFENETLRGKTTMVPLDLTHQVLATKEVRELLLYGPDGRSGKGPGPEAEVVDEKVLEGEGKSSLRRMLVELLMFFAKTYDDVFGISEGPPLHDPLAVAAILMGTDQEIKFYDHDPNDTNGDLSDPERYQVKVVTEGTLEDAHKGTNELGRTIARRLPAGTAGVRIPRGLDIPSFWTAIERCVERADEVNARPPGEAGEGLGQANK